MGSVNQRMAVGAAWMIGFRLIDRGIGLVSTLILARLLVPADFGLLAMATSFIALVELLGAFGFEVALIQMRNPERRHFDTAWTLTVLLGVVTATIMIATSIPLATFYDEPRLTPVIVVLALASIVTAFENIGIVEFRRQMSFDLDFKFQIAKKLAAFSITVPLAIGTRSYWALVAGMLAGRVVSSAWSYRVHPFRPRLSLSAARELAKFSKWLLANNFVQFLRMRGSDFIVGRIVGSGALGVYNIGYEIASLPTTELLAPINRAVLPGYAQLASDPLAMRHGFVNVIATSTLVSVPAGFGVAAVAPLLCEVLLGPKWLDAIPVIELAAFQAVIVALQSSFYPAYFALGRPDLVTRLNGAHAALLLPLSVFLTLRGGIVGTALAGLVASAVFAPVNYAVLLPRLGVSVRVLAQSLWRPLGASAAMFWATREVMVALAAYVPKLPLLLCSVAVGAATYVSLIAVLWALSGQPRGGESFVLDRAVSVLKRR
jgi:lipopolysaccharide exporter